MEESRRKRPAPKSSQCIDENLRINAAGKEKKCEKERKMQTKSKTTMTMAKGAVNQHNMQTSFQNVAAHSSTRE
jgi:hypothetical protein